ncbi:MAG: hypothetical protein L0Y54_14915 [Sporichthyaceae bacterium]|nr:hypothetical protein [Sporichthyaceae bacterium]
MTTQHPHQQRPNDTTTADPATSSAPRGPGRLVDLTVIQAHWLNLDPDLSGAELVDRLWLVACDVPVLLAEIERSQRLLRIARRRLADLLAATRAALAAAAEGDPDPLTYLLDELDARDPLPPIGGGR